MSPSALLSIRVCSQYCYPKEVSPPLFLFLTYYEVAQLCSPLMNLAEEQLKRFASAKKKGGRVFKLIKNMLVLYHQGAAVSAQIPCQGFWPSNNVTIFHGLLSQLSGR